MFSSQLGSAQLGKFQLGAIPTSDVNAFYLTVHPRITIVASKDKFIVTCRPLFDIRTVGGVPTRQYDSTPGVFSLGRFQLGAVRDHIRGKIGYPGAYVMSVSPRFEITVVVARSLGIRVTVSPRFRIEAHSGYTDGHGIVHTPYFHMGVHPRIKFKSVGVRMRMTAKPVFFFSLATHANFHITAVPRLRFYLRVGQEATCFVGQGIVPVSPPNDQNFVF